MNEPVTQSIWTTLARHVGGKILTALLVVGVGLTCYWFYRNPEQLNTVWEVIKYSLIWIGFVLIVPWALFFLPGMVLRMESNLAATGLLGFYLLLDLLTAWWLAGWDFEGGALTWAVRIVGFLAASIYNFMVADFLASHAESI